jgi:hypothetical protein
MTLTAATGIALILSTLIYHGGVAYLFARAEFGDVLKAPQRGSDGSPSDGGRSGRECPW